MGIIEDEDVGGMPAEGGMEMPSKVAEEDFEEGLEVLYEVGHVSFASVGAVVRQGDFHFISFVSVGVSSPVMGATLFSRPRIFYAHSLRPFS